MGLPCLVLSRQIQKKCYFTSSNKSTLFHTFTIKCLPYNTDQTSQIATKKYFTAPTRLGLELAKSDGLGNIFSYHNKQINCRGYIELGLAWKREENQTEQARLITDPPPTSNSTLSIKKKLANNKRKKIKKKKIMRK